MGLHLLFLGGTGTVTGSKYLLEINGKRFLIDCGLFQGWKLLRLRNWSPFPIDPASLDAVILTHAHLDHSGYLPLLVREGFTGQVYCTSGTRDLCGILLPDSGHLLEEEASYANARHSSKHDPALPLYTEFDAVRCLPQLRACPFDSEIELGQGITLRFRPAGHIVGAAMVDIGIGDRHILFSGDLGRPADLVMKPPAHVTRADWLLVESTYGNRLHEPADPRDRLGQIIRRTVTHSGVVLIPTFAVGRAQSLLYLIHQLKSSGEIPAVPIYLNSPMAVDATEIFVRHQGEHRLSPEQCEVMCRAAKIIQSAEESIWLNEQKGPMIILAASGMATGGRILHHLKAFAPDPRNAIVFTGFQAGGTRGAAIVGGADSIRIYGDDVPIRARVESLENFSAHADANEILAWLHGFRSAPEQTFVVHGEPDAADALRKRIATELHWNVCVPDYLQHVELPL
ncbi:MBL fold metallo-hydrolase [Crenobacter sp. SG2305]|uniref:MBL fold metallo-hydrolase RNA specificity domain-containing protein n=1 Tax=Crenobacter oryzisoli TaxID=3056844 RepID=UPI0025AB0285|nr:MBL fold metallo-hydrolase [Crenobacter sp. SG2305]MDN0081957.1 MBL fold metallo-hydrolase [Crenobacter sp. SG2305]